MDTPSATSSSIVFSLPSSLGLPTPGAAQRDSTPQRVVARTSILRAGKTIITRDDCVLALVQLDEVATPALAVRLSPDEPEMDALKHASDVCLLAAGASATARRVSNSEVMMYEIPKSSIAAFASSNSEYRANSLRAPHFASDSFLHMLSRSIRPIVEIKNAYSGDLVEYFAFTFYSHLLDRYGTENVAPQRFVGGLSPSHRRIVEEAFRAPLGSAITIESMSAKCQLSGRHFARAFRQSFGAPFYKFLLNARLQHAKLLLAETDMSLKEIAGQIGYADQATFTESFTRTMGIPPGRYRRRYGVADVILQRLM